MEERMARQVHQEVREVGRAVAEEIRFLKEEVRLLKEEVRSLKDHGAGLAERTELARHRLLTAVQDEAVAASDRQQDLLTAVQRSTRNVVKVQRQQTSEVEALLQLFQGFEPRAPMPSSGNWAFDPTGLLELLFITDRKRPNLVLELGSGTSSVWIAYALERTRGRLVSLDHNRAFAERTTAILAWHDLSRVAEVRHAPLRPLSLGGEEFQWYDVEALAGVDHVDLLVVDGPPGSTGPRARYPAVPVLQARLSASAVVVLDDIDRPDEREVAQRWAETTPGLAREREIVGRQAVLTYSRPEVS